MTMNESFFGQYSVFCVFGSVVGCVVVPLIAQVLQQQSMECVILSAIVISLTAAHLNKKSGTDSANSAKILLTKELERKKIIHNNNNAKKQKHCTAHSTHHIPNHEQFQHNDQEYLQQHEHLKVIEMERRNEEKRLKKLKKREERLKRKEEENKKQQELEEKYRTIKEKRQKQKEDLYKATNSTYYKSSMASFEKYCSIEHTDNRQRYRLCAVDENKPRKQYYSNNQKIPRFQRSRTGSVESTPLKSTQHYPGRSMTSNLSIGCTNLSASCSSLSSVSSSGSSSPPLPSSPPPTNNAAWKKTVDNQESPVFDIPQVFWPNTKSTSRTSPIRETGGKTQFCKAGQRNEKLAVSINSSSLFCTQHDAVDKSNSAFREREAYGGEYSLFGPQKFGSIANSPIF